MNVGQLIEALKQFPPETPVYYDDYEGLSNQGFDVDAVEMCGPDPPVVPGWFSGPDRASEAERVEWARREELDRIETGRDKPWVLIR